MQTTETSFILVDAPTLRVASSFSLMNSSFQINAFSILANTDRGILNLRSKYSAEYTIYSFHYVNSKRWEASWKSRRLFRFWGRRYSSL